MFTNNRDFFVYFYKFQVKSFRKCIPLTKKNNFFDCFYASFAISQANVFRNCFFSKIIDAYIFTISKIRFR